MFKRHSIGLIEEALEDTPVILVNGARQVGKSTLCKQLISDGVFKGESITLDDPATLAAALADPMGFLKGLNKHLIIDEVQRAPGLFLSIKKLVDDDRKRVRYILTGSADVMTLPKIADSLAGRIEIHSLWPLSAGEILNRESRFLEILTSSKQQFSSSVSDWSDMLEMMHIGGYPEVVLRKTDGRRSKWFASYLASIIQKDIQELSRIEGLSEIPKILHLLSTRVSSTVNFSDIARLSGVKNTTLQRYLALLEQVFLVLKIPAWTPNAEGRYVKSPKVIINDTGLLCHIAGIDKAGLVIDRTAAGPVLENFVTMEILKQIGWFSKTLKPFHFSMHKGAEVDLVLEDQQKNIYAIEIKSTVTLRQNDFKGLKRLEEIAGKKFKKGVLLYTGDQLLSGFGGKNLWAVPLSQLWYS